MPAISMFYGIIIYMYFFDNKMHNLPHIHAKYQNDEVVVEIPEGKVLEGAVPVNKLKLILAWIEIHKEELMANWELAKNGEMVFKIDGLK
jgi:shikimate kinase